MGVAARILLSLHWSYLSDDVKISHSSASLRAEVAIGPVSIFLGSCLSASAQKGMRFLSSSLRWDLRASIKGSLSSGLFQELGAWELGTGSAGWAGGLHLAVCWLQFPSIGCWGVSINLELAVDINTSLHLCRYLFHPLHQYCSLTDSPHSSLHPPRHVPTSTPLLRFHPSCHVRSCRGPVQTLHCSLLPTRSHGSVRSTRCPCLHSILPLTATHSVPRFTVTLANGLLDSCVPLPLRFGFGVLRVV